MLSGMEIIDDFLDEEYFLRLSKLFNEELPWYLSTIVSCDIKSPITGYESSNKNKQMSHIFVNHKAKSIWLKELDELFNKLNAKDIYRAKANLIFNTNKKTVGGWHYDNQVDKDIKIAILYFDNNNGYTLLEDGTKVKSKKNRVLKFNDDVLHTSVAQTDKDTRIVLNINYK